MEYLTVISILIQVLQTILAKKGDTTGQKILDELISNKEMMQQLVTKIEEVTKKSSRILTSNPNVQNIFTGNPQVKFETLQIMYASTATAASMDYLLGKPGTSPVFPNPDPVAQAFKTNKCPECGNQLHTIGTSMGCKYCGWPYK